MFSLKTIKSLGTVTVAMALAVGCTKPQEDAAKEAADKAAAEAKANSLRNEKTSDDLARLREIAEKQEADRLAAEARQKEYGRQIKEGSAAPIKELKY